MSVEKDEICPKCGTVFPAEKAPWLLKAVHCARHDVVSPAGTPCSACVAEKADAEERERIEKESASEVHSGSTGSDSAAPVVQAKQD